MKKHEIEIEGLPEGLEITHAEVTTPTNHVYDGMAIGVILTVKKKKQPRRIVLEETGELAQKYKSGRYPAQAVTESITLHNQPNIWREVKESDLSLHNDDDKESLRLSMDECKAIITGNVYANPIIIDKLRNFIKDSK